jgi:murein DD-endopeptidase MepM/ murein hydrolase activator NlpD
MRLHPILGYSRKHQGVDFAAPGGTAIYAAGDGVVVRLGRAGGYGNYVEVEHNQQYTTAYAHLSGFARGLREGERVRQGEVIGYVGATGTATGPHLHYEMHYRGAQNAVGDAARRRRPEGVRGAPRRRRGAGHRTAA